MQQAPNAPFLGSIKVGGFTTPSGFQPPASNVSFEPRNTGSLRGQAAAFLNTATRTTSWSSAHLKTVDFIPQQFSCPPWLDESEKYMMPEMLCFAVNEPTLDGSATVISTLAHTNQLLYNGYKDFEQMLADGDDDAGTFKNLLEIHGEQAIETYHQARKDPNLMATIGNVDGLQLLYTLATRDVFCYLTRFGILNKFSYLGSIINLNRATSNEDWDRTSYTEHYTVVNVCMAKRARLSNCFGPADLVTTGTKLWLMLKRKQRQTRDGLMYQEYAIFPGGTKMVERPLQQHHLHYLDASMRAMSGHVWPVGVVNVPAASPPSESVIAAAANTGVAPSEVNAYNAHALLPTIFVSLGLTS